MDLQTKEYLDLLVEKYEIKDFIKDDPVQFPYRFENKKDIEIAAFLASIFAYGKRQVFIEKLNLLFKKLGPSPYQFIIDFNRDNHILDNFNYRFSRGIDIIQIIMILKVLYTSGETLETLFSYGWNNTKTIQGTLQTVIDYFYSRVTLPVTKGFYHLLPNPSNKSACKRLNMFLRWMVRNGEVDLGLWSFIPKSELLIPLDTHVAKISRALGLLERTQNDYKALIELMNRLKEFDPNDPVKYDFAMFGYGVNN